MVDSLKPVLATLVALLLAGCSTVGDLGRPRPVSSFAPIKSSASFNETDEERQMQDRIWRFLKLAGTALSIDQPEYYLGDVAKVLGILISIARG